ncbi:MAG: hypothetical protein GY797_24520 [Deltaproteobacteria bacterium]|nr:hypothetical protein [Deltaproteobacteria bacterium]
MSLTLYVGGPVEFRKWQAEIKYSIIVRIELPASVMFSYERKGVMQLLHQIVTVVEQKAIEIGFEKSKAFAGGSCTIISWDSPTYRQNLLS